jgi:Gnt-I system high-affinity gluconate transporter
MSSSLLLSILFIASLGLLILSIVLLKVNAILKVFINLALCAGLFAVLYYLTGDPVRPFLIIFAAITFLVVFISHYKINAFLSFLIISFATGLLLGIPVSKITKSVQYGIGDMLGGLVIVVVCGAMLGKLTADSGAAQRIASGMMSLFGRRYIQWALVVTGFIIGIPLFYNVGFVLVMPLIFSVAYQYKIPPVYIGLPMLASLSVTHGFLPPHPAPTALVGQFGADMGTTLWYGVLIGIPTVILAGPLFAKTLKGIQSTSIKTFQTDYIEETKPPGLANSIFSALLPVILLAATTLLLDDQTIEEQLPPIVMIVSLLVATFTLGVAQGTSMKKIMDIYGESVKDIAMLVLIMGGAGGLKQIMIDSGVSKQIGFMLLSLNAHPLVLGWAIACIIRVCVGSATVAGLTAAGIVTPLLAQPGVDANLMVLAVGAGSLMFSHVNDAGFWMYKEYFNLSIKDTLRSWSLMETVVSVVGIIGVMILNAILH